MVIARPKGYVTIAMGGMETVSVVMVALAVLGLGPTRVLQELVASVVVSFTPLIIEAKMVSMALMDYIATD